MQAGESTPSCSALRKDTALGKMGAVLITEIHFMSSRARAPSILLQAQATALFGNPNKDHRLILI